MDNPWVIVLICAAIALIAINFSVQSIRMNRSRLGKVLNIYRNVRYNEKLVSKFGYRGVKAGFQTRAWDENKYDIDYLPEEIRVELDSLFEKIHKLNLEIGSIVEGRGETALTRVDADTIKQPLTDVRQRLDEWIKKNQSNPEVAPRRPGFWGF